MAERGAGQPRWELSPYEVSVQYGGARGIVTGTGADWFGPLTPLAPTIPAEVKGRAWDFPSGWNVNVRPRANEPITFSDLRGLADGYDLLRLVIETRKDQVERIGGHVMARDKKRKRADDPRIKAIETFFRRPDGEHSYAVWLRMVLEDLFVIDAPSLYVERTRGGRMVALHPLDGATIKRIIDDWGRTPRPYTEGGRLIYPPAYQQYLKGQLLNYTARDLIYRPRNQRVHKAYGYSPVEQVIMTVNIALRRQVFQLQYYTEGNVPEALIGVPDGWTPDQIRQFQDYWDATFTGNTAQRRHAKFIPGGVAKTFIQTKEAELKNVFDEWLARVVCFAFSISNQNFVTQVNRATSDTQKEMAEEEGLAPILAWVKGLIDDIIADEFDAPDLEWDWGEDQQIDPEQEQRIITGYVQSGLLTLDEGRDRIGQDPYPNGQGAQPLVLTPTGYVPLNAFDIQQQQAKAEATAQQNDKSAEPNAGGADQLADA